jgi:hypothetical protein
VTHFTPDSYLPNGRDRHAPTRGSVAARVASVFDHDRYVFEVEPITLGA